MRLPAAKLFCVSDKAIATLLFLASLTPSIALGDTTVSTLIIADDDVELSRITEVGIGLRRGIRRVEGVAYRDQGELLAQREFSDALFDATESLPALEEEVRENPRRNTRQRINNVIRVFENNLELVSKANLASAHLLSALTWCTQNRQARCREGFAYVLTFRESFVYDTARYPAAYEALFEETRAMLLADGRRGSLTVRTMPTGAEVFVDGRSIGPSPARLEGALVGQHYVTVKAPGHLETVMRAAVPDGRMGETTIALEESPSALLLRQNTPRILRELGPLQAGPAIRAIDGYMPVNQVVIGVLSSPSRGNAIALYLYDLRTNFLLANRDARLGLSIPQQTERLAEELYQGVNLDGRVAAPEAPPREDDGEVWEQWWFWAAVGVAAASGTAAAIALSPSDPEIPQGTLRIRGTVQ